MRPGIMFVLCLAVTSSVSASPLSTQQVLRFASQSDVPKGFAKNKLAKGLQENPEVDMNSSELITSKGYPLELYNVVTEDGYILGLFRIPYGVNNKNYKGSRPTVLLQHGLDGSCDDWLMNPANESLAFVLADAGADVWLGNSRGNKHSRNHTTLNPSQLEFWEFSWDEMAKYDLPAVIHFILNKTGQEQIYYVGHSQGTTIGFAQFGEDPKLGAKIKHFMALAPIGRVDHNTCIISYLAPLASLGEWLLDLFGHGELGVSESFMRVFAADVCQKWGEEICENFIFVFGGYDYASLNASRVDVYLSHNTAGTSGRDLLHWAQMVDAKQFQHFDYGEKENLDRYGQKTPPLYDATKMKVPVAIFRGGKDTMADETDVAWLLPQLNVTHDIYVPHYEHQDMTLAFDAVTTIYQTIIEIVMGKNGS